jgi:hypothetical protein
VRSRSLCCGLGAASRGAATRRGACERLAELQEGLAAESSAWLGAKHPLTVKERQWYVGFLEQARAALRNARDSLAMAVKRLELDALTEAGRFRQPERGHG